MPGVSVTIRKVMTSAIAAFMRAARMPCKFMAIHIGARILCETVTQGTCLTGFNWGSISRLTQKRIRRRRRTRPCPGSL